MTDLLLVHLKNGSSLCMDVQVHRLCQISFHSTKAPVDLTVQLFDLLKLFSSFATFSAAKCGQVFNIITSGFITSLIFESKLVGKVAPAMVTLNWNYYVNMEKKSGKRFLTPELTERPAPDLPNCCRNKSVSSLNRNARNG